MRTIYIYSVSFSSSHSKKIASPSICLPQAHLPKANVAKHLSSWLSQKIELIEET